MSKYSTSPVYADLTPLPLDQGGPSPLAAIAYSDDYAETMAYLRALMAADEKSERALEVTEDLVEMNPAHYTVWLYRMGVLRALAAAGGGTGVWKGKVVGVEEGVEDEQGKTKEEKEEGEGRTLFEQELDWLNDIAQRNQKNYQIWQHRQGVILGLAGAAAGGVSSTEAAAHFAAENKHQNEQIQTLIRKEQAFIERMFELDAKNYHVWSYRQWLVRTFALWPDDAVAASNQQSATTDIRCQDFGELAFTDRMLRADVRNNSAWCHRWFILNGAPASTSGGAFKKDPQLRRCESQYAQQAIRRAPQNQSAWNYLRGLVREGGLLDQASAEDEEAKEVRRELHAFVEDFANLEVPERVVSSFALELLGELVGFGEGGIERAGRAFELLGERFDPLRKRYWGYRRDLLVERRQGFAAVA